MALKPSDVHISQPMSNIAAKYTFPGFVAEQIYPVVMVKKEADVYYQFRREELIRQKSKRADGAPAEDVNWNVDNVPYACQEYALRGKLTDRVRDNADSILQVQSRTTEIPTKGVLLDYEMRVQESVQNTAVYTNTSVPAVKWDAASGVVIEQNVDVAKEAIRAATGMEANTIVMNAPVSRSVVRYLKAQSTEITYKEMATLGKLPEYLWDLKVVIGKGVKNSAVEGQTEVIADIWNDNVFIAYVNPRPALHDISAGWTFRKTRGAQGWITKTWRNEEIDSTYFQPSVVQVEKVVAADLGYILATVLT